MDSAMNDNENTNEVRGDDGLTDDERRIAKQEMRDAEQRKVDADGDAVRARQEREHGEPEGSRGRNVKVAGEPGPEKTDVPSGAKVTRTARNNAGK
jgi:hypothetical protein